MRSDPSELKELRPMCRWREPKLSVFSEIPHRRRNSGMVAEEISQQLWHFELLKYEGTVILVYR
jgi:hypothetical protein